MKDESLSSKIARTNFTTVTNFIRVKDVKDFIQKLKEDFSIRLKDEFPDDYRLIEEIIDKRAGEELTKKGDENEK